MLPDMLPRFLADNPMYRLLADTITVSNHLLGYIESGVQYPTRKVEV